MSRSPIQDAHDLLQRWESAIANRFTDLSGRQRAAGPGVLQNPSAIDIGSAVIYLGVGGVTVSFKATEGAQGIGPMTHISDFPSATGFEPKILTILRDAIMKWFDAKEAELQKWVDREKARIARVEKEIGAIIEPFKVEVAEAELEKQRVDPTKAQELPGWTLCAACGHARNRHAKDWANGRNTGCCEAVGCACQKYQVDF